MAKNKVLAYNGQGGMDLTTGMPMDPVTGMPINQGNMPSPVVNPKATKKPTKRSTRRAPKSAKLA